MTTSDNIAAIEKALEGVTPGRWGQFHPSYAPEAEGTPFSTWDTSHDLSAIKDGKKFGRIATFKHSADAAYVDACSPDRISALLAEARKAEAMEQEIASANAELERLRRECSDGLDALSDIDDFWEACPYPDNRKHLSPAEQISSLDCELNAAHDENTRLRGLIEEASRCLEGEPEYHEQGMGCGLEDRGITDRYDAMSHGWEQAMERVYGENIAWAKDALASARTLLNGGSDAQG